MATIFIDFDSNGDVELIFKKKDNTCFSQEALQASTSSEQEESAMYNVGPLSIKVKEPWVPRTQRTERANFVEIELLGPEDEPTAMMIILGILCGTSAQVPIQLDLPTLNKVAVLVDKYQWHALVTPHAISWFDHLVDSQGLPDAFDENLLMWLWIAWLFEKKDHFKALSRVAQQDACNSIDLADENIRLSTRVLIAINGQRKVAFQKIEQALEGFKRRLLDCEAELKDSLPAQKMLRYMVFGFATFCSQDLKLGDFAVPDHAGSSIRLLRNHINLSQSMQGFSVGTSNGVRRHIHPGGSWDLKNELQKVISDLKMEEWGLDYDDFKPSLPDRVSDSK
ncbi:hypothetical protein F5884DRAFT_901370 [Xylogone sp. PMI_703]|nr:hypothetical protein F5884DRAFT_901370 [Xylogone sp. PMI_703]